SCPSRRRPAPGAAWVAVPAGPGSLRPRHGAGHRPGQMAAAPGTGAIRAPVAAVVVPDPGEWFLAAGAGSSGEPAALQRPGVAGWDECRGQTDPARLPSADGAVGAPHH